MSLLESASDKINLQQLIGRLVSNYQPVAVTQRSFFVNDIAPGLFIGSDQKILSTFLSSIFYIVARCSKDSCITIYASAYDDRAALNIKNTGSGSNYGVLYEFQHLQLFAKQIGGFLEITSYQNKETTISFNFANNLPVANPVIKELKRA